MVTSIDDKKPSDPDLAEDQYFVTGLVLVRNPSSIAPPTSLSYARTYCHVQCHCLVSISLSLSLFSINISGSHLRFQIHIQSVTLVVVIAVTSAVLICATKRGSRADEYKKKDGASQDEDGDVELQVVSTENQEKVITGDPYYTETEQI